MDTLNSKHMSKSNSNTPQLPNVDANTSKSTSKMYTTYDVAVKWCSNNLIRCNDIPSIDESVYDNFRFPFYDEEGNFAHEIYQFYLTDCSEWEVEYLEEHFGLLFTYSEKLDLFVLCVDHLGTAWNYVMIETDLEPAEAEQGTRATDRA